MNKRIGIASMVACAGLALPALGQDSISTLRELPGDAVSPWTLTEQCNNYVLDLVPITTSWGNNFGTGPVAKGSKVSAPFFTSLFGSQAMSHDMLVGVPAVAGQYSLWNQPGQGVNGEFNTPGQAFTPAGPTTQTTFTFSEFGNIETNNVIGGFINIDPNDPSRLLVSRQVVAVNAPNAGASSSQFGMGAADADGYITFRADGFGTTGPNAITGNNIFRVPMQTRNCNAINMINNLGASDIAHRVVNNSATTHSTPNAMPNSVAGRPVYLGSNFTTQYVYESAPLVPTSVPAPIGTNIDIRGTLAYSSANPFSTGVATAGTLSRNAATVMDTISVWSIDANGNPAGGQANFTIPTGVTDGCDGHALPADAEFDHYHSQVPFRGGNSQVAMGQDQQGRFLVAGVVYHDVVTTSDPFNSIAVARFNPLTGAVDWTLAAWLGLNPLSGKAILDGPGGNRVGELLTTPGHSGDLNISLSGPAMDSVGNVWFLGNYFLDADPLTTSRGLFRSVYTKDCDPVTPGEQWGYELELVMSMGTAYGNILTGANSATDYQIRFSQLFDFNSVSSGTVWSGNVTEGAFMGMDPSTLTTDDPRTLGGMVLSATISYDSNGGDANLDGDRFNEFDPTDLPGDAPTDEVYNVLMYLGAVGSAQPPCAADCNGDGVADVLDFFSFVVSFNQGNPTQPCPDVNGDGVVDVLDFFGFVVAFNQGCP